MIKELINHLAAQLKLLEELLTVLERETHEMAGINLAAMAEINALKEDLSIRIEAHTVPLRPLIEEVAVSTGLRPGATLGELAVLMGNQENKEIPRLHQKLNHVAGRIQQVAAMNRDIAENFVKTVTLSLNFLSRIINQSQLYGASGGFQRNQTGAAIINRKV